MTTFNHRVKDYVARVQTALNARLPPADSAPARLHEAMRYAALSEGKRVRPLLCYAAGETLGIEAGELDDAAAAVELIHAFSLIHDDLPAMDDDALRRGRPTTHQAFDTATAILAGDALQTLAFTVLANSPLPPTSRAAMLRTLATATGSEGMTGGQAMDLAAEGRRITRSELENLHRHKTGCLIRAAVMMPCDVRVDINEATRNGLAQFADCIGLAFQIRDDVLDVEGKTEALGKTSGADAAHDKSTYPALMGLQAARKHADEKYREALAALEPFGKDAEPLRWMGRFIVDRDR